MYVCFRAAVVLLGGIFVVPGCGGAGGGGSGKPGSSASSGGKIVLIAFVGSASKPPTFEAKEAFEAANPEIAIAMTFGGSGTLLNQMALEQTGDVYMPGSDDYMEKAEALGAVVQGTRRVAAYLVPTICVREGNPRRIASLGDLARPGLAVGLAQAGAVCLGDVSEEILRSAGLEAKVKRNVTRTRSMRSSRWQLVQLGEVDAIIGWDAFEKWAPDQIDCVPIAPEHLRVRNISAAVSKYSEHPGAAQKFIDFLASDEGKAIYAKHGYSVEPPKI